MSRHCCSQSPAVASYKGEPSKGSRQVVSGFVSDQSPPLSVTIPGVKLRSYCVSGFISCEAHLSQPSFTLHTIFVFLIVIVVECSYKCISFSVSGGSVLLTPGVGRAPPHSTCHSPGSQCSCNRYKLCRPPGKYLHII